MNQNKIAELEQWLIDNPEHESRTLIEGDLRKLLTPDPSPKERGGSTEGGRTYERDTFDFRELNIYDV